MTKAQITVPLDILDVRVLHGQDEWVVIKHLPAFGRPTYFRYRPNRYQCQDCEGHPTTSQSLEWHDPKSPHSFTYDNHILLQLVNSTLEDVSMKEGITYDCVLGALERRIDVNVAWTMMAQIDSLGLDEIALKKGQGHYVTLITGRFRDGEIVILGVLPGHEKAVVVDFLRLIPQRILQNVQSVCCDLWEAYTAAVREEIPTARIVADHFHVARHYRDAADELRKQELHRLKKELSEEEYKTLKGSMPAFRKNAKDLNKEERKTLRNFFEHSVSAQQSYDLREQLTAIFDTHLSKKQAQTKILRWIQQVQNSKLYCYDNFLKLLHTGWEEITNYFIQRENSGFVEGFNNKVKILKRRCYRIFNLKQLFQRIYLDLSGYRLFAPAPTYG